MVNDTIYISKNGIIRNTVIISPYDSSELNGDRPASPIFRDFKLPTRNRDGPEFLKNESRDRDGTGIENLSPFKTLV